MSPKCALLWVDMPFFVKHCYKVQPPPNPVVEALWSLYSTMQTASPFITDRYLQGAALNPSIAHVYFSSIVRAVQVAMHEYFVGVDTNIAAGYVGIDLPDLRTLVIELKRGTFQYSSHWVPLPEEYVTPPAPPRGATGGSARGAPSMVTTDDSSRGTTRTGMSSLTGLTGGRATANDPQRSSVARVDNPAPDSDFTSITVRPGGTRPILREHRPPANDAGQELCVAWWLRDGCFPTCGRRATHRAFASTAERARLLAFCREHLAAPAAGGT